MQNAHRNFSSTSHGKPIMRFIILAAGLQIVIISSILSNTQPSCVGEVFSTTKPLFLSNMSIVTPPKIFVQPSLKNIAKTPENKYPGFALQQTSTMLAPISSWLWVHDEYKADEYMVHRALHDSNLFTDRIEEAHLCFPSCHATVYAPIGNELEIAVKKGSESMFSGCSKLTIGIETPMSTCSFPVPYWHSLYSNQGTRPWELSIPKQNMLSFVGGSWRGTSRMQTISTMQTISDENKANTRRLFYAPFVFRTHQNEQGVWGTDTFYKQVWKLYATSVFSWQPVGDTATRRGFFDSWLLGCIPVISKSSACTYRNLFGRRLFLPPAPAFEDMVIVLEDSVMLDGAAIIWKLSSIDEGEIEIRKQRMAQISPAMQWGWTDSSFDALRVAIFSVLSDS